MSKIEQIKGEITSLGTHDVLELSDFIAAFVQSQKAKIAFARREAKILESACPHCGFSCFMKWGKADNGNQRFKCRTCKATISTTTNTAVYRLRHRDKWARFMDFLSSHISVEGLAKTHFKGMSPNTMLRWRHRFLSAFMSNGQIAMTGVVQVDEKLFRQSFKGSATAIANSGRKARNRGVSQFRGRSREQIAVLTAIDSNGVIYQDMLGHVNKAVVVNALSPWLSADNVLMSDGLGAYATVAKNIGCKHIVEKTTKGRFPRLAHINSYHTAIENLVNRKCLGVATKNLMKYFAWMRHITMKGAFGEGMLEMVLA